MSAVTFTIPKIKAPVIEIPERDGIEFFVPGIIGTVEVPTPAYEGEYTVTPLAFQSVVLETEGLRMESDVTVLEIPYYRTANLSGGLTAFIGYQEG